MAFIDRKTMLALIDATGHAGVERAVAIQYVKKDGSIGQYICRKYVKNRIQGPDQSPGSKGSYNIRNRGLIKVIDTSANRIKNLFIYAIIGFHPKGDINNFYKVQHGH